MPQKANSTARKPAARRASAGSAKSANKSSANSAKGAKGAKGAKKPAAKSAPRAKAAKRKRAVKVGQIERTKTAVLSATVELLGEVPFGKLTVDLISERSGASRSTIYRYWKTLPELVSEAYDSAIDPDPPLPEVDDLQTQLVLLFSELPRNLEGKVWGHLLPSLVAASNTDKDFKGTLQKISHRRRKGIRRLLQNAVDDGRLKPDTNIEWVIDALSSTSYVRHLITGGSLSEEGHIAWLVETVFNAIKAD